MSELQVRIVRLEPMRMASVHGFGPNPESIALEKLIAWARPRGLFDDRSKHRIFGFDNPAPSPGSPNYGYEFWMAVAPEMEPEGEVKIVDFLGGLYAVTRCQGLDNIGKMWKQLVQWRDDSKYRRGTHQWLEENVGPLAPTPENLILDLHLPIVE